MPAFGTSSRRKLDSCHSDLIAICEIVIMNYDFTVLEGHRADKRQEELFRKGMSKLRGGESKHNSNPSMAVDLCPWPIDWSDHRRFYFLAGLIKQAAVDLGVDIRQGCDWDGDGIYSDQSFHDLGHFELMK